MASKSSESSNGAEFRLKKEKLEFLQSIKQDLDEKYKNRADADTNLVVKKQQIARKIQNAYKAHKAKELFNELPGV